MDLQVHAEQVLIKLNEFSENTLLDWSVSNWRKPV
jgi:hypothetical protein